VPVPIRKIIGQREVWISLGTSSKRQASVIAGEIYAKVDHLFHHVAGAGSLPEKFNLRRYLLDMIQHHPSDPGSTYEKMTRRLDIQRRHLDGAPRSMIDSFLSGVDSRNSFLMDQIKGLSGELDVARATGNKGREDQLLSMLGQAIAKIPDPSNPVIAVQQAVAHAPEPLRPRLPISLVIEKHLKTKTRSPKFIKDTNKTLSLFISCFGDMDVREINGNIVGDFKDALMSLSSNHGRDRAGLSIQEEIDKTLAEELETITPKTASNHLGRMSPAWAELVRRETVPRNPWQGWSFDTSKKVIRRSWTDEELRTLADAEWTTSVVSRRTCIGMIMMAMFTGMRLGEIANIRNADIQDVDGVSCFLLREHDNDDWKPKTLAGIRNVPIHPELMRFGIMDFMERGEKYLFNELRGSDARSRGQSFAHEFSKHKTRLGLPLAVTFHGFRHTVSTRLRNVRADIREIWIDALLGHEASHKSMGTLNYTTQIDTDNLYEVVKLIDYGDIMMRP